MLRLGIIGAGGIASLHTHNILSGKCPEVQLTAMADRKESRREWIRATVPDAAVFCEGSDLIASDTCDAVLIATPHYQHPTLAIEAFRHGKHVLCEKPAGVYTLQVRDMIAEADKHPELTFGMMFNQRTNCVYRKAKTLIDSGALGEIKRMIWVVTDWYRTQSYYDAGAWRATWDGEGGGVLLNQMVHELDYLYYLFGQPKSVYALGGINGNLGIDVEDNLDAIYRYESEQGTFPVSVHADFYQYPPSRFVKVVGEKGHIIVDLLKAEVTQAVGDEVTVIPYPDFARNDMFIEELKLFIDCIREDTEPAIPLADGIVSLKMALAARKSMETGGVIDEFTGTV